MTVDKKRSIGIAAKEVGVQEYVIRFWETQFPDFIKPSIGVGGRRYYYDSDIDTLLKVKKYLYEDGYTIKGLQNLLKNKKTSTDVKKEVQYHHDTSLNASAPNNDNQYFNSRESNTYNQPSPESTNDNYDNRVLKSKLLDFRNHLLNFSIKLENIY